MDITQILADEFKLRTEQVRVVTDLLDAGNTIPFIARYRKEATGALEDQLLRDLCERMNYLRSLEGRREEIIRSMEALGALTDAFLDRLGACRTLVEMEDLYRPYRPKRRTRATIARERGLEPLANWLLMQPPRGDLEREAAKYVSGEKGVQDRDGALSGARDIIAETISDDAGLRKALRDDMTRTSVLITSAIDDENSVYRTYSEYTEAISRMPSHRVLAINRAEREGALKAGLNVSDERAVQTIRRSYVKNASPAGAQVSEACEDAWKRLIFPSLEREVRAQLTERASRDAIRVFSQNLHQLLMQPPIRGKVVLGVDPGFRTGCKLAVVDENGKVLATGVGHFTLPGQTAARQAAQRLIDGFIGKYGVTAIAIGNGTASRESEQFISELIRKWPEVSYMIVSEAGASVYSASRLAAEEFPDYDVTLRSAVSIARRMQDPLAELVKIDPKSIGVGQYQHDLKESELSQALDGVVEQCVNAVGVELSTASAQLLEHVAGIGPKLAKNIVAYREEYGLPTRSALKKVPKLGPKAFEQCAGFLRVRASENPLDASGVHPESYAATERLLKKLNHHLTDLKSGGISGIAREAEAYGLSALSEETQIGLQTLRDILNELEKPGRDPRDELPKPVLRKDVLDLSDLKPGMELTGTVRNVADFGAFVDIGVHQDGLVHISKISDRFIRHPGEVLHVGDVVTVWVLNVDAPRKRISLTMVRDKT